MNKEKQIISLKIFTFICSKYIVFIFKTVESTDN